MHAGRLRGCDAVRPRAVGQPDGCGDEYGCSGLGVQRQRRSFRSDDRDAVTTAALILLGVVIVFALLRSRRMSAKAPDLGRISDTWLAEEAATPPRRF